MRTLLLLLLLAAALAWVYTRYHPNPAASGALQCPATIAWYEIDTSPVASGPPFDAVTAIDGPRWRTEVRYRGGKSLIALYNGQSYSGTIPQQAVQKIDPIPPLQKVFNDLPIAHYDGAYQMGGHSCWRFTSNQGDRNEAIWIDQQTHFPVRISGTVDGKSLDERYVVLSIDVQKNVDILFNRTARPYLFGNYFAPARNVALGSSYLDSAPAQ